MSTPHEPSVVAPSRKSWRQRALVALAGIAACALIALLFIPSAFERASRLFVEPASGAMAAGSNQFISPAEARAQKLAAAKTAVHGMFVKDPYGCVYMFQYLSAQLSLTPVLDENNRQVCDK